MTIYADKGTLKHTYQRSIDDRISEQIGGRLNLYPTATEEYMAEQTSQEVQSITGDQLATIVNRISDIRGVTDSLFGKLSPILVQTPRETTAVKEKQTSAPTQLGQSLDDIIDQLGGALSYLRDLHETIRL